MTGPRYVCVHGHFYQPPRENPWLESIERQPGAWPAHDWNERVADECYGPNAHARILDASGDLVSVTNNYARMSFNIGPTLLGWLEEARPRTYGQILKADRDSAVRFGGHGSAIAQVYNHMILPLASVRDQVTQVRWGLRDFEHRFGRKAEGMWLAETAVDTASLEALAEAGVGYTILAPHQCAEVRAPGGEWIDVTGQRVDPRRPYIAHLPSGRSISLFFYDGPISRAVAFEGLLDDGHVFAQRILSSLDGSDEPQLAHIATDGETYGHHHRYGEMALAVALGRFEQDSSAQLTNYGQLLSLHPPTWEARIVERTSWSCMHGIERWRADCGCNSGTGWHQRWRGPLRDAFDWLRDQIGPRYEEESAGCLRDPWEARDAYIDVVLDRSEDNVDRFLEEHGCAGLSGQQRQRVLELLEMQRHLMLMYTSCGWFFDEPSGLETIQVLRYAARAIQLAERVLDLRLETAFRERLTLAPSNRPEYGDVDGIYRAHVQPSMIDLLDVGAHFAIASIFEDAKNLELPGYQAEWIERDLSRTGNSRLVTGRLRVHSRITLESRDFAYAVLHFGDHNISGGIRPYARAAGYVATQGALSQTFNRAELTEVLRQIQRQFEGDSGGRTFSLRALFHDEQAAILERLLRDRTREVEHTLKGIYDQTAPLIRFVQSLGHPAPEVFRAAAEYTLRVRLRAAVSAGTLIDLNRVARLLGEAGDAQIALDPVALGFALASTLQELLDAVVGSPDDPTLTARLAELTAFVASSPWKMDLGDQQELMWRHMSAHLPRWKAEGGAAAEQLAELVRASARSLRISVAL